MNADGCVLFMSGEKYLNSNIPANHLMNADAVDVSISQWFPFHMQQFERSMPRHACPASTSHASSHNLSYSKQHGT